MLHWFICWVIHDESRTTARTNPILNFRSTHSVPLYIFFHEQVSLSNHKILKRCSDIAETLRNIKNIYETRIFEQYCILFLLKPFLRKKNQLIESNRCSSRTVSRKILVQRTLSCVKYARIRVFSDPYFPI